MTNPRPIVRGDAEFLLYQTEDGRTRLEVRFDGDTAWLSLGQLATLFQRDKSVISRHIKNIFEEGEPTGSRSSTTSSASRSGTSSPTPESVSHDAAVRKAELEYDRFAATRAALPSPVERHFDDAVREVKLLEKKRPPGGEAPVTATPAPREGDRLFTTGFLGPTCRLAAPLNNLGSLPQHAEREPAFGFQGATAADDKERAPRLPRRSSCPSSSTTRSRAFVHDVKWLRL